MDHQLIEGLFPIRLSPVLQTNGVNAKSEELHRYWRNHAGEGYLERYWPGEADHDSWIPAIRKLLAQQLPQLAGGEIEYFSAGTFNRLYSISSPAWNRVFLLRVSIPVEPFFKTESEVATLEYVRQHTTMPVPRVIAFSSSADNPLGYEWIITEMLDGVPLRTVWDRMPPASRSRLFAELAGHVKGLLSLRFSMLGNIYFADVASRVGTLPRLCKLSNGNGNSNGTGSSSDNVDVGIAPHGKFVIGRMVSQDFFFDKRVHFPGSRGPFRTARELVDARVGVLGKRLLSLSTDPREPYYCENDVALARYDRVVGELFAQLRDLVPRLVPRQNGPEDAGVLWHDDLSEHNLLVDPFTFGLRGVVDWESVSIVPAYETRGGLPAFLSDRDCRPPPLVLLERGVLPLVGDGGAAAMLARREAELGAIRREYHAIVGPLYDDDSDEVKRRVQGKQGLARQLEIASFQHRPWATAEWIEDIRRTMADDDSGVSDGTCDSGTA